MNEKSFEQQLHDYQKNKRTMFIVILGLGILGGSTAFITEGWIVFLLMSLLLGVMLYQKRIGDMKATLIKAAVENVSRDINASCSNKLFDEKTCRDSLFFPFYINSFYLNMDIPRQVCLINNQNCVLQFSILSFGEVFAKIVKKVGKHYVVRSGAHGVTSRISSEGIFFSCLMPFPFLEKRLILPKKWGCHLENNSVTNFIGHSFHKETPPPLSLLREINSSTWLYGSNSNLQERDDDFWIKCYSKLQKYPFSLLSITDCSVYIYIPFSWKTSPKHMVQSLAEYKNIIKLVKELIFNDILPWQHAQQILNIEE